MSGAMPWEFGALTPLRYGVILADPPWYFRNRSQKGEIKNPVAHYDCMEVAAIAALNVNQLAAPDCLLFLWATWPMLTQALHVMAAWGFTYKTGGAWHKTTKHGKTANGPGYLLRSSSEPFILGTLGAPRSQSKSERGLIMAEVREHSRKPNAAHEMLERMFPDARRCELFARTTRPGWEPWGNEVGKFGREEGP